jgi:lipopolysaccharide transport system ATP-binding protein
MDNSQPILSVNSLTKEFHKDGKPLLALNNVSFELKKKEILGIIGRNGSGKSTLLKVLSQITGVTSGTISYDGKLTSIIEIGTGFHPDLTGNENILLSGQLLGYRMDDANAYREIVEFSGLEDFMDMPVKHYSSGMYLRLAFAIAFHSKIDILLLDEVLTVGDADFRRKCHDKIRELRHDGASVVIVSHQMESIIEFCDRCIWMDNGKIEEIGLPLDIIENYIESTQLKSVKVRGEASSADRLMGQDFLNLENPYVRIDKIEISAKGKRSDELILITDVVQISLDCEKLVPDESIEFVFTLTNFNNIRVLTDSYGLRNVYEPKLIKMGHYNIMCEIPAQLLNRGVYDLSVIICKNAKSFIVEGNQVARLKIAASDDLRFGAEISTVIRPYLNWDVKKIGE